MITLATKKNMRKNGNWNDISLKLVMENVKVNDNLQIVVQRWGVLVNHSATTCMGLQSREKRERRCVVERKRCISRICENVVDLASNHKDIVAIAKNIEEKKLLSRMTYLGGGGYNGLRNEILTCICECKDKVCRRSMFNQHRKSLHELI